MRVIRLLEAAARAELLRLTAFGQRVAMRIVWAVVALVLAAAALACLHVAVVARLLESMTLIQASLVMAAVDAVLAVILAVLAMRGGQSRAERDALALRRQIWTGNERDLALVSIATTVFNLVWRRR
jgi:hypothetical protein